MPRIRYLKPEFFKDEDIAELPVHIRLFYMGLWTLADKAGRLEDRPKRFKAELFPYETADIEKMLQTLCKPKPASGRPFLHRYTTDRQRFIQIVSWSEHQKPHNTEKASTIPPPPPYGEGNGEDKDKPARSELGVKDTLDNSFVTVIEPKPSLKAKYGDFVQLTADEHGKLIKRFTKKGTEERIDELNEGIGSKGYKYESHYHTILAWDRKHKKDHPDPEIGSEELDEAAAEALFRGHVDGN